MAETNFELPAPSNSRKKIWLWGSFFTVLGAALYVLNPFILTLCLGGMFGIAFIPLERYFAKQRRLGPRMSAALCCFLLLIFILVPLIFISYKLVTYLQNSDVLSQEVGRINSRISETFEDKIVALGLPIDLTLIKSMLNQGTTKIFGVLTGFASSLITSGPIIAVQFVIMVLTTYMILLKHRKVEAFVLSYDKKTRRLINDLRDILFEVCRGIVFTNILTGIIQASLVGLGVWAITNYDPAVAFAVSFVFSFIPVIGAGPIVAAVALFEFMDGHIGRGIAMCVLTAIVGLSDNIVRAWLLSKEDNESMFLNLLACIGGIYVFGLPGLFVGPLIVRIAAKVLPILLLEISNQYSRKRQPSIKSKITIPAGNGHRNLPLGKNSTGDGEIFS